MFFCAKPPYAAKKKYLIQLQNGFEYLLLVKVFPKTEKPQLFPIIYAADSQCDKLGDVALREPTAIATSTCWGLKYLGLGTLGSGQPVICRAII